MKTKILLSAALFLLVIFPARLVNAQGNNLSDYQYQLDLYRTNFAEYQILKNDYDAHPTLANEQKAILAAKRAIVSRELTLAYYFLTIVDSLTGSSVDYPLVNQAITDLNTIAQFHFGKSQEAGKIVTRSDLTQFTLKYLAAVAAQKDSIAHAQVANKIAQLIRFQREAKRAYDALVPTLQATIEDVNVQNGIGQIQVYSQQINDQIAALAESTKNTSFESRGVDQFFEDTSQTLIQIRSLQTRLINIIIDLDTNYANH